MINYFIKRFLRKKTIPKKFSLVEELNRRVEKLDATETEIAAIIGDLRKAGISCFILKPKKFRELKFQKDPRYWWNQD